MANEEIAMVTTDCTVTVLHFLKQILFFLYIYNITMVFIELKENDSTYRLYTYRGQPFRRLRNDNTGNYGIYEQYLPRNKTQQLKQIYGANGDVANVSSSLLLRFPSAKKHNVKNVLRDQVLAAFKAYDNTSVLSTFEVDTSQHYEDGVYIYLNVSWAGDDTDAETKSDMLLNNIDAIITIMSSTLPQPFDSVVLSTSLNPVTMKSFVLPTILSITTTYVEDAHNTDVEVKTVGLYDHIGIKINTEDDNGYRRLRNQQITTAAEYYDLSNPGGYDNILNIVGVDPTEDTFIATLFDNDYKKQYTSIQTPTIYIQQTQGTNGDLLNETVDGSITLDLNFNDFTTENQTDFVDTMNSETGGDTTIVNTFEGSAIVEYRVIFDVSKTQQEIDDVVTKLNDDVEIHNIINKSATMNGVVARKTVNKTTKREWKLTKKAKVVDVIYDEPNSKILFKTIGSYKHILYKATEQDTFLSTTNKTVDLPPGFTNKIDVKLVDVSDGDISPVKTHNFDVTPPFITLLGDASMWLTPGGNAYVEPGATVTDDSGETITPVITGAVDVNTEGTYTITYTATDSSGNESSKVRTVHVEYIRLKTYDISNGVLIIKSPSFNLGYNDWTIELWMYYNESVTDEPCISLSGPGSAMQFRIASNNINVWSTDWDGQGSDYQKRTVSMPTSAWFHVAMQSRNGKLEAFVNGVLTSFSISWAGTARQAVANQLVIGGRFNNRYESFHNIPGEITNVRISAGGAVYAANFTPSFPLRQTDKTVFLLGDDYVDLTTNATVETYATVLHDRAINGQFETVSPFYISYSTIYYDSSSAYDSVNKKISTSNGAIAIVTSSFTALGIDVNSEWSIGLKFTLNTPGISGNYFHCGTGAPSGDAGGILTNSIALKGFLNDGYTKEFPTGTVDINVGELHYVIIARVNGYINMRMYNNTSVEIGNFTSTVEVNYTPGTENQVVLGIYCSSDPVVYFDPILIKRGPPLTLDDFNDI